MDLKEIGQRAKDASYILGTMDSQRKNEGLRAAASELSGRREEILRANEEDLRLARERAWPRGFWTGCCSPRSASKGSSRAWPRS